MQRQRPGARPAANSYVRASQERNQRLEKRLSLVLFGALCLFVPPIGLIALWRSGKIGTPSRFLFSAAALASMTFIFSMTVRAGSGTAGILPVPQTPRQVGYNSAVVMPAATTVPVVIDTGAENGGLTISYAPNDSGFGEDGGELPIEPVVQIPIVYAVTNNATYYHYQQMCDMQNNSRALTLVEAVAEGLLPCEKCVLAAEAAFGE